MNSNAPEELKVAFDNKTLCLEDLVNHPDWIEWLVGDEDYVREECSLGRQYVNWRYNELRNLPERIEDYMNFLFNDYLRNDILENDEIREGAITEAFKERNSDLFFDDLPFDLQSFFKYRSGSINAIAGLSAENKALLKGKNMARAFSPKYQEFFSVFGGDIESFDLYSRYEGIMDIVINDVRYMYQLKNDDEREEEIKRIFLDSVENSIIRYSDEVPEDFREEHQEYFLDKDAPESLKEIFYHQGASIIGFTEMNFKALRNRPEDIKFLRGKNISHCFGYNKKFFKFCGNQDIAMDLGLKYGDRILNLDYDLENDSGEDKEKQLEEIVYDAIINHYYLYDDSMPESFKNRYPELFLDNDAPVILKRNFYTFKGGFAGRAAMKFDFIKENPEYIEYLKGKNLYAAMKYQWEYVYDLCGRDNDKFMEVGLDYGDVLVKEEIIKTQKSLEKSNLGIGGEVTEFLDDLIAISMENGDFSNYNDSLPLHFQYKHPDRFLLPEELEVIRREIASEVYSEEDAQDRLDEIKGRFYGKCISFGNLSKNEALKKIMRSKNIARTMKFYNAELLFNRFAELFNGNWDKAYNLMINRYSDQLDSFLYADEGEERIDKLIEIYKEAKFIPNANVLKKLPNEKIKGFALNRKLWGKLMEVDDFNSDDDYIGSLFELALVMGVFETKEFTKNDRVMIQGIGEESYEELIGLLHYVPDYIDDITDMHNKTEELYVNVGEGYKKLEEDYEDAIRYRRIQTAFSRENLLDELREGSLTSSDILKLRRSYFDEEEFDYSFKCDESGYYQCILDENSNSKVKKLLKTIGIKKDRYLSPEQFEEIKASNRELVKQAFIVQGNKYRFNISKKNDYYVLGNEETDETGSKQNKRLFDYVRFLLQESGLEDLAMTLAANNDRSNIDLVLNNENAEKIFTLADKICDKAQSKYLKTEFYMLTEKGRKRYKYLSSGRAHQLFDGLQMEYSKDFRNFILENKESIVEDIFATEYVNLYQRKLKELSQDPDYAGIKLTPEVLIKAMIPSQQHYSNKKIGFEKGEELAQKFGFSQEYFEEAQKLWEVARAREASSIPRIMGQNEKYSYEVLRLDDAMGIYAGNITDCCQKIGGAGETAMVHSMYEKNGRVFIVRDERKKIIAQSWLWRNDNVICFDNVEVPDRANNMENQQAIYRILKKASKEMCDKDKEVIERLVEEGRLKKEKAEKLMVKKVTVGKGHNDINIIADNTDRRFEDDEIKRPIEEGNQYGVVSTSRLYILDSNHQFILYKAEDYIPQKSNETIAIYYDDNTELSYEDISESNIRTMKEILKEVEEKEVYNLESKEDLLKKYELNEEDVKLVLGTDWFMLYSEKDEEITVHKMLKSPSSGIKKKSVREQKEAVKMLMDKGKRISMEFENDRVYRAAKSMVRHMQNSYTMKVADEGDRISVSEISQR